MELLQSQLGRTSFVFVPAKRIRRRDCNCLSGFSSRCLPPTTFVHKPHSLSRHLLTGNRLEVCFILVPGSPLSFQFFEKRPVPSCKWAFFISRSNCVNSS